MGWFKNFIHAIQPVHAAQTVVSIASHVSHGDFAGVANDLAVGYGLKPDPRDQHPAGAPNLDPAAPGGQYLYAPPEQQPVYYQPTYGGSYLGGYDYAPANQPATMYGGGYSPWDSSISQQGYLGVTLQPQTYSPASPISGGTWEDFQAALLTQAYQ